MRDQVIRTPITELFGIRHPILCGGMLHLSDARYVAAVVNAGGMAFLCARNFPDPQRYFDELRRCEELTEGRPFGANLSMTPDPARPGYPQSHVEMVLRTGVRFVETSGQNPAPVLPSLQAAGVRVLHKAPSVRHALAAQRAGVDALALVGTEAGGHPGTTMTGSMVQAGLIAGRFDVPVVLAGGIGTGAQILRALAMGADGVLLGTRMLVAGELWPHGDYKQRIAAAQADDSCMVLRWTQRPRRVLCNDAARRLLDLEREGRLDDTAVAALTRRDDTVRAYRSGDCAAGMLACGQAVAFANGIQPVESIIDGLIDQFVTARRRFERRFGGPSS